MPTDALPSLLLLLPANPCPPWSCSATPSRPQDGLYGAGAHSDYGMLTFLATDGVPGLQICPDRATGEWVDVPPLEGCYIVNLGDMLER